METLQHPDSPSIASALFARTQARSYLGNISDSMYKSLVASGQLREVAIGRRRLISRVELDRFIADRQMGRS